MNNKKLTVTIGIPAYNEETNIQRVLISIFSQNQLLYRIKKVIVISDGSKDLTVQKAREIKDKRIQIINNKINRGRISILNQLMKEANTDILLFLDADEELQDAFSINKLVAEFRRSKNVALVGGNPITELGNNFVSKCQGTSREMYTNIRYQISNGNNIYGCMGGMLALSKNFYKGMSIPSDIYADDAYMYLTCMKKGLKFRNARGASIAHYLKPNWNLHIKRTSRHSQTKNDLRKYFGSKIDEELSIPKSLLLKEGLKIFLRKPVYVVSLFTVNCYVRLKKTISTKKLNYSY